MRKRAMSRRYFSLTQHLSGFIDEMVKSKRHPDASDVVREALRRYEEDIKAEEAAIWAVAERGIADIERGAFTLIRNEEEARALFDRLSLKATKRVAAKAKRAKSPTRDRSTAPTRS